MYRSRKQLAKSFKNQTLAKKPQANQWKEAACLSSFLVTVTCNFLLA